VAGGQAVDVGEDAHIGAGSCAGVVPESGEAMSETPQAIREAFCAGFNAGWDADGTPLTFTERMEETLAEWLARRDSPPPSSPMVEQARAFLLDDIENQCFAASLGGSIDTDAIERDVDALIAVARAAAASVDD
jgi:hypothetical protein